MNLVLAASLAAICAMPTEWFEEQARKGSAAFDIGKWQDAKSAFQELERHACGRDVDWCVVSRWRAAYCDFRLGHAAAAQQSLEQLLDQHPTHGLALQMERDLGIFYKHDWKLQAAEKHLDRALQLAPKFVYRGQAGQLMPFEVTRIRLMKADCLTMEGKNAPAKTLLLQVEKEIRAEIDALRDEQNRPLIDEDYEENYADCEIHLAELERRDQDTLGSLTRLKSVLQRLAGFEISGSLRTELSTVIQTSAQIFLANAYSKLARFTDAEAAVERAQELIARPFKDRRRHGVQHSEVERAWAQVAIEKSLSVFEDQPHEPGLLAQLDGADAHVARAMELVLQVLPQQSVSVAEISALAGTAAELRSRIHDAGGRADEAQAFRRIATRQISDSIQTYRQFISPEHDVILGLRLARARLAWKLGDTKSARDEANDVLQLYAGRYGDDAVQRILCHLLLTELESQAGQVEIARLHAASHRRLANKNLLAYLTGLTSAEQLQFFRRWDDPGLHASLRLGIDHAAVREESADWLLNGKARAAEVLALVNQDQQASRDPQNSENRTQLDAVKRQAVLLHGPATSSAEQRKDELQAEERIKRDLAEKRHRRHVPDWRRVSDLRKCLKPEEAFVDLFSVNDNSNQSSAYHAWIITAEALHVVRLGDRAKIKLLVNELAEVMASVDSKSGAAKSERELQQTCLRPLSEQLLWPIQKVVPDKTHWIVSPDADLWCIPWSALLTEDGKYAVESMTTRYVVSGRDLLQPVKKPAPQLGPALVVADPAYNLAVRRGANRVDAVRGGNVFANLPEGLAEGKQIAALLPDAKLLTGAKAVKSAITTLAAPPKLLYLTTHAFYRPARGMLVADSFLECGIALAGANDAVTSTAKELPGLLTGAEVLSVNLQGTELVVLSACQTGSGAVKPGHSAASLRHAFHLAGARAVIASLWEVDNASTRDLMAPLMQEVSQGTNPAAALRQSQLRLIARLRTSESDTAPGHAHPFFWAAFTYSSSGT